MGALSGMGALATMETIKPTPEFREGRNLVTYLQGYAEEEMAPGLCQSQ
jgi:hypothetical protein